MQYLEVLALYICQVVIAGDFNIRAEKTDNAAAARLRELINSFGRTQHVPAVPTHQAGGTLDLVITKSDQIILELSVNPPSSREDSFQALRDHLQVSPSNRSAVLPGAVCTSYS